MKILCDCGQMAVWENMDCTYWCDGCVPRNCDFCNTEYVGPESLDSEEMDKLLCDPKNWVVTTDEHGRPSPCIEIGFDKEGFEYELDTQTPVSNELHSGVDTDVVVGYNGYTGPIILEPNASPISNNSICIGGDGPSSGRIYNPIGDGLECTTNVT